MWILRRPSENNFVYCIPVGREFTIGRIECSLTITDDKSVSRKHAIITLPSAKGNPILSDCNSKFGSFVNGNAVKGESGLCSGDAVKFGGAGSEFVIEQKDFSVFVSKTCCREDVDKIRILAFDFGIPVLQDANEANYFVLNDDFKREPDSDLVIALLLAKYIVSPSYFLQLQNNQSTFSMALIQPASVSKMYPLDCWIPQRGRLTTFRKVFEGIRRFVLFESEAEEVKKVLKAITGIIGGIETKIIKPDDPIDNLTFNELFVDSSLTQIKVSKNPIRSISFSSILAALVRCDGQLVEINTIYPVKSGEDEKFKKFEPGNPSSIDTINAITTTNVVNSAISTISTTEKLDYNGPSLTALIPMPTGFLRPNTSASHNTKTKFVKCHPKNRQPGTIPALIGPDQLQICQATSSAPTTSSTTSTTTSSKRRLLGLDPWLNEDDFVVGGEEKRRERNKQTGSGQRKLVPIPSDDENISNPQNQRETPVANSKLTVVPSNTPVPENKPSPTSSSSSSTTTTTSKTPPPATITSKFQSSFFKNLTKGK